MKTTQLFRKHKGVFALLYITIMLIWLGVIFCKNFTKDKSTVLCFDLPWNFHNNSCLLVLFSVKTDFDFVLFSPICWQTCCSHAKKDASLNLFVKVRDEVQNVFVKSSQSRSGLSALLKISARCRRRTWLEDWCGTTADCQIRMELQACDWANMQSRRQHSPREMINLTVISLSSGAMRSCHGHKYIIADVFSHCVNTALSLGCFDYIKIFLFKILTHLSTFGFILCRKKRRLKYCITCTAKHVHVQYKQHNLRHRFFYGPLCIIRRVVCLSVLL